MPQDPKKLASLTGLKKQVWPAPSTCLEYDAAAIESSAQPCTCSNMFRLDKQTTNNTHNILEAKQKLGSKSHYSILWSDYGGIRSCNGLLWAEMVPGTKPQNQAATSIVKRKCGLRICMNLCTTGILYLNDSTWYHLVVMVGANLCKQSKRLLACIWAASRKTSRSVAFRSWGKSTMSKNVEERVAVFENFLQCEKMCANCFLDKVHKL